MGKTDRQLLVHNGDNIVVYQKGDLIFIFNFDPARSYEGYFVPVTEAGQYQVIMSTDDFCYGGHGRVFHQRYDGKLAPDDRTGFQCYLPSRSAIILRKIIQRKR